MLEDTLDPTASLGILAALRYAKYVTRDPIMKRDLQITSACFLFNSPTYLLYNSPTYWNIPELGREGPLAALVSQPSRARSEPLQRHVSTICQDFALASSSGLGCPLPVAGKRHALERGI